MTKKATENLMSIGIDIVKDTFNLIGFDCDGELVPRKRKSSGMPWSRLSKGFQDVLSAWKRV